MERELEREERERRAKEGEAAAKAAQLEKVRCLFCVMILSITMTCHVQVKQAFLDDRKSKAMRDRREAQARTAAVRRGSTPPVSPPTVRTPPGTGRTLRGTLVTDTPPPYNQAADIDDVDDDEDD